jgi:hypothetical protein
MTIHKNNEYKNFFKIFNNLKPILEKIKEEHNDILNTLEKENLYLPFINESDFSYIPNSEEFYLDHEYQDFVFSEEIYLGCGDYEIKKGFIPFNWLYEENWQDKTIQKYKDLFKHKELDYIEQQHKNKAIKNKELEEQRKQYEILKEKFKGEI